jgi:hypothetical protein
VGKLHHILRKSVTLFLATLCILTAFCAASPIQTVKGQSIENKNVILIGWDGVQRNHLYELLNRSALPNLASFIDQGTMVNITVSDHGTDTKAGWTQILTGYRWWRTGAFNNVYWFHGIPSGYTIPERVESYFGSNKVITGFVVGKLFHMEIRDGTGDAITGRYTHEALYRNLLPALDICTNGDRNDSIIGPAMLQFVTNRANNHFFSFFHFSDPDSAGHNPQGGENSVMYEQAIVRCDFWLGQLVDKLKTLGIDQKTQIYLAIDHGFDEGGFAHNFAPYITLASNDKRVARNGDQIDVAPTVYYGLGMWGNNFSPALDGFPLQIDLPQGVQQAREEILADSVQPPKATFISPVDGASVTGTVTIAFNTSDKYLNAVYLLIDSSLKADGGWNWQTSDVVTANGSYSWDTSALQTGSHTITLISTDEHGAYTLPSISSITVNKPSLSTPNTIPTPAYTYSTPHQTTKPTVIPTQTISTSKTLEPTLTPSSPSPTPQSSSPEFPSWYLFTAILVAAIILGTAGLTGYLWLKLKK